MPLAPFKPRILVLPIAALLLTVLTAWKLTRPYAEQDIPRGPAGYLARAPLFVLEDQRPPAEHAEFAPRTPGELPGMPRRPSVRLATYLGRHRILIAFFDGRAGVPPDPVLLHLRERFAEIDAMGTKVFAVSTAPQPDLERFLAEQGDFPFPLLHDPNGFATAQWGRAERDPSGRPLRTLAGLFVVDRAGNVPWSSTAPVPEPDPIQTIDAIARGG